MQKKMMIKIENFKNGERIFRYFLDTEFKIMEKVLEYLGIFL